MRKTTKLAGIAFSPLMVILSAQAEPISDQGLIRSFVETAVLPGKTYDDGLVLPAGMRQAVSMANLFAERDVQKEGFVGYDCRDSGVPPSVMLKLESPEETSPRVF